MGVGEYLIIFAAILIGLAVADLSLSLHRLLRQGRDIKWHPIVPATGFIVLCLILNLWWGLYNGLSDAREMGFLVFLPTVFMLLTLFLLSAAVFPDEKLEKGASVLDFYLANRTQFWGLFATYLMLANVGMFMIGYQREWGPLEYLGAGGLNTVWMALCIALIFTERMIFHWIVVTMCLVISLLAWSDLELTQAAAG
ncbi:MAG: hypothetical protein AAF251_16345 [Pseudomonadota bacterium]